MCVGATVRSSRDLPLLLPPRGPWLGTGNRLFGFPGRPCPTLHVPAAVALLTGAQVGTRQTHICDRQARRSGWRSYVPAGCSSVPCKRFTRSPDSEPQAGEEMQSSSHRRSGVGMAGS